MIFYLISTAVVWVIALLLYNRDSFKNQRDSFVKRDKISVLIFLFIPLINILILMTYIIILLWMKDYSNKS